MHNKYLYGVEVLPAPELSDLDWVPPDEDDLPYDDGLRNTYMYGVEVLPAPELSDLNWVPPDEDDLPYDDGMPMESARHVSQMVLLIETLQLHLSGRDAFVAGNMFLYFSIEPGRPAKAVGPDVFVALDVPSVRERERKSWVVWKERKVPDVVIELLSDSTAKYDRTSKKLLYQNEMQVPEYFYADPFSDEVAGFELNDGQYQPIIADVEDRLLSKKLGLALGQWHGVYGEIEAYWWRFYTPDGIVLPTVAEAAQQRAAELEALVSRYKAQFGELGEAS